MLVAGPNLALSRVARLPTLVPGEVLRFTSAEVMAGGKGVNACRAALALGTPARLVALVPGHTGAALAALIREEGIELLEVPCEGEVRVATIVVEESGRVTVLNEPGPELGKARWEVYEASVASSRGDGEWLLCMGLLPPGAPVDGYARLVAPAAGRALVDTRGAELEAALRARPAVVKVNLFEAEGDLAAAPVNGTEPLRERALAAAQGLVRRGAGAALVTAGSQGAALASAKLAEWLPAPGVRAVNPVGAGDCFAAALAGALEEGRSLAAAARWAVAAAAASVEEPLPGMVSAARARELAG